MKQADFWLNLKALKDVALKLKRDFKGDMPFSTFRIQVLEGENINCLFEQFPKELFEDIGGAYDYDNLYLFVLPEYLENVFSELDKIDSRIVECLGQGFFEKTVKKDLFLEMCMFYEKKKARKGIVKVNTSRLKWLSEPIFRIEEGRGVVLTEGNNKEIVIGLGYFSPEEWPLFRKYSQDNLDETYEEWKQGYGRLKNELEKEGKKVMEVQINIEEMQNYFTKKGWENLSRNRAKYVSEKLIELNESGEFGK